MFGNFHHKYDDDDDDDDDDKKFGKRSYLDFAQRMGEQMLREMEESEPQVSDIGIFLDKATLSDWWDNNFNDQPFLQHPFGTKLMAGPMLFTVVGSKMISESAYDEQSPCYVVKPKNAPYSFLSQIDYVAAHEGGWKVGWDDEKDEPDEQYDKLVEIANTNRRKNEEDERGVVLDYNTNMNQWNEEEGPFVDAFWKISFTPREQKQLSRQQLLSNSTSFIHDDNITIRKLLMRLVLAWTNDNAGGAIVTNQRRTKFQVMEFFGPIKQERENIAVPMIDIQYANAANMNDAELFLRDENTHVIECSDALARTLEHNIMQHAVGKGLNDILSGLVLFEARLVPIEPFCDNTTNVIPPSYSFQEHSIPHGTFGIEFELSCAIGTQPQTVGWALKEHAGVIVKLREQKLSRSGFRYTYLGCSKEDVDDHEWTIGPDGSIRTNPNWAQSSPWELASPILSGREGLEECHRVLTTVTDTSAIQINDSMGMHVHIGVDANINLEELKSICQNFILYEDVMDSFLGRTENKYCHGHANCMSVSELVSCQTKEDLYDVVNPKGRHHKLNLQNLKKRTRPTIEFRQHSANFDAIKAEAWIRFCMLLVYHSQSTITVVKRQSSNNNTEIDDLFDNLIHDQSLKEYYRKLATTTKTAAASYESGSGK